MGYNVIDIINKAINLEEKTKITIKSVIIKNQTPPVLNLIYKILCNKIDIRIKYYEQLREEARNEEIEEIDIRIYDKISFLINEFNNRIYIKQVTNSKEYLKFILDLAKDKYSLFIDIQGRLVNNMNDTKTHTYKILSKIINNINEQIITIEKTIA